MDIARLNSFPLELRKRVQFICWHLKQIREGTWVRQPVNPHTGGLAACDDPATWSDWNTAVAYCQAHEATVSGLARVLVANDILDADGHTLTWRDVPNLMAVEFRNCLDSQGHLIHDHPGAKWVGELNSYSEITPDGKRVITWCYATHSLGNSTVRTKHLDAGRAIAVFRSQWLPLTGQRLIKFSGIVEHRQAAIDALYRALWGAEDARSKSSPPSWPRQRQSFTRESPPARNVTPIGASAAPGARPGAAHPGADPGAAPTLKIDEAKELLRAMLRNGAVAQGRIIAAAKDRGITEITLRRAKKDLAVQSTRQMYQGKVLWEFRR